MSQENLQTMIMQTFWGVKKVYYGIVQVVNNQIAILLARLETVLPSPFLLTFQEHEI